MGLEKGVHVYYGVWANFQDAMPCVLMNVARSSAAIRCCWPYRTARGFSALSGHCAQYLESKIGSRSSKQQPQLPLNDSSVIVTLDQQDRKRLEQQRVAEVVSSTCSTERSSAFVATSTKNRVDATAESSVSPVVKRPLLSSAKIAAHHASAAGKLTRNTNAPPPPQNNTPDFQQPMKRSGSPSLLTNDKVSEKGSGDAETEPPLPKLFSKKDLSSLTKSNGKTVIQQPTMNKNPFASPGLIKAFASGGVAQRQDAKATSTPSSGAAKSSNPDGKLMIKKDKKTPASTDKCAVYGLAHNDNQISAEVSSLMNELVQNVSELLEGGMKLNSDGPSNIPRGRRLFNTNRNPVVKTTPFEARKVNKIAILDSSMKFGMLIDRKVRQCGYYSDTFPITAKAVDLLTQGFEAIIISGDMNSSYANEGQIDSQLFTCGLPVLGICQGFHAVNTHFGGRSGKGVIVDEGESIVVMDITSPLFEGLSCTESVYLRKGECIKSDTVAKNFSVISTSPTGYVAGVADAENRIYAVQFHPEHDLTECGVKILKNFLNKICKFPANYDLDYREAKCIYDIQEMMGGNGALVLASGGLLSTVSVKLLQKALGEDRVYPVHVETGLGRLNESEETLKMLKQYGINAIYRDFTKDFLGAEAINDKGRFVWMRGACSPEDKRKLVVESFITVKNKMIKQLGLDYQDTCLSQSTLRSDIIKREFREMLFSDFSEDYIDIPHYNVYHPLQDFYREELQELARKYGFPEHIVNRYSFPSAGLATRIICTEGPYLDCDFELIQERLCWLCDMWRVPVENMQDNPELEETINNLSTDEFSFLRTQDFELEASLVPMKVRGYNGAAKKDSYVVALSTNQEPVPWEFMAFFAKIIPKIIPSITRVVYAFGKKISPNVDDLTESCISRMTVRKLAYADKVANSVLAGYLYDDVPAPGLKDCRDKLKAMPVLLLPVHFDRPEFMFPSRNWSVCLRPVVYSDYATVKPAVPGIDLPEATILKMAERVKSTVPFINRVLLDLTSFPPGTVEWE
ncbi:hypothetical protein QR680_000803 [Steinernema hermaphroditum]|uniref:GMP synthase (glutamine-hydrolyzing) n=1 Tax=Steinernema hermaphroditum TaxID=289476 RepID=A0AA39GXX8_9BILA|nr:hypothetical protein QR680_000803 [Steinernema hermaphroditum]